jgi:hypothetical protein
MPWPLFFLTALALSVGWGIRGNFGHEYGAMIPGALAAMAAVLLSRRPDWWRRVAYFGFFGALGWSFGGSISYMQVIGYTHSGHSPSVLYGFACLFVTGFLWAAIGGAGTALPALLDRERLSEFFIPLTAVFVAWWIQGFAVGFVETHSPDFRHEDPLYWYDTNWLDVLVALIAVLALGVVRRRLDWGSRLILFMTVGWWAGFLILVVGLGWRMTPPRGDNWAGCLGMTAGMLLYFRRERLDGAVLAALVSGFLGGFSFATATMLKLVEITGGGQTNWHSILEQTYGFLNGIAIAAAMLLLARRAPPVSDDPPRRRWTEPYAVAFLLAVVTHLNLSKNPEQWVKAHAMPAALYGLSALAWFNLAYGLLGAAIVALLVRHLRRPLPLLPATWLGRGQLLFLLFLWWVVIGNFERALVSFAPERLVTEGVIHLNAMLLTLGIVFFPERAGVVPSSAAPDYRPLIRRTVALGLAGLFLTVLVDWAIVRGLYGDRFAGQSGLHIRFGPRATVTPGPRPGQPHP